MESRLNEDVEQPNRPSPALIDVLDDVSLNFPVVQQSTATEKRLMAAVSACFKVAVAS